MTRQVYGDDSATVWIDHGGLMHETAKAKLFKVHGDELWVPKSVIVDEGEEQLGLAQWWADKNGLEGDW